MGGLIAKILSGFSTYFIGKAVAKVLGVVTFVTVSTTMINYLIDQIFDTLGGMQYVDVLKIGGMTQFLGIVAGACLFNAAMRGYDSFFVGGKR